MSTPAGGPTPPRPDQVYVPSQAVVAPGSPGPGGPNLQGVSVTFAATAPAHPKKGDLWYNSAAGYQLNQWNGTAWVPYQYGTDAISAGSITAGELAAGIVYAGIINGTTVNAATFNGSTFNTTDGMLNDNGLFQYSGTPAAGNLTLSVSQTTGTDAYGNAYLVGFCSYSSDWYGDYLCCQFLDGEISFWESSTYYGWSMIGASITISSDGEITLAGTGIQLPGDATVYGKIQTSGTITSDTNVNCVNTNCSGHCDAATYNGATIPLPDQSAPGDGADLPAVATSLTLLIHNMKDAGLMS